MLGDNLKGQETATEDPGVDSGAGKGEENLIRRIADTPANSIYDPRT